MGAHRQPAAVVARPVHDPVPGRRADRDQSMSAPAPSFPGWVPDAVFYQVFPDRFCNGDRASDPPGTGPWGSAPTRESFFGGDLQGGLDKLDYLQDLGMNALYRNPIFKAR